MWCLLTIISCYVTRISVRNITLTHVMDHNGNNPLFGRKSSWTNVEAFWIWKTTPPSKLCKPLEVIIWQYLQPCPGQPGDIRLPPSHPGSREAEQTEQTGVWRQETVFYLQIVSKHNKHKVDREGSELWSGNW